MTKLLPKFLGAVGLTLAFASVYLEGHYVNTLPKVPNQKEGRNYPLNIHGTTVYLTNAEKSTSDYIQIGAVVFCICGGLLWRRSDVENKKV